MSSSGKVCELPEAVAQLVRPGDSVVLGCALEGFIPFAAVHEIIRQRIGPLTLVGPISNISFDQMIAAGIVERVIAAWVGNVSTGIGYNFQRAVEQGRPRPLEVINHSNFSVTLALEAGARGLPMAVSMSPLGSDMVKDNPHFREITCPFTGRKLLAVRAINPDVAIVHVQQADPQGNCRVWGAVGFTPQAVGAAQRVIITCEELVDTDVIRADPDRTLIPGFMVDAVCEVPWGAHPAPVQGYYDLDGEFFLEYAQATREEAGARAWLDEWVYGVRDRAQYMQKLPRARWHGLMVRQSLPSPPVEYGW